jgi:hypothetical protein
VISISLYETELDSSPGPPGLRKMAPCLSRRQQPVPSQRGEIKRTGWLYQEQGIE